MFLLHFTINHRLIETYTATALNYKKLFKYHFRSKNLQLSDKFTDVLFHGQIGKPDFQVKIVGHQKEQKDVPSFDPFVVVFEVFHLHGGILFAAPGQSEKNTKGTFLLDCRPTWRLCGIFCSKTLQI